MLKDVYNIRSYDDCASAIREIEEHIKNGTQPNYSDWDEIFQTYLFQISPDGYNDAIDAINRLVRD